MKVNESTKGQDIDTPTSNSSINCQSAGVVSKGDTESISNRPVNGLVSSNESATKVPGSSQSDLVAGGKTVDPAPKTSSDQDDSINLIEDISIDRENSDNGFNNGTEDPTEPESLTSEDTSVNFLADALIVSSHGIVNEYDTGTCSGEDTTRTPEHPNGNSCHVRKTTNAPDEDSKARSTTDVHPSKVDPDQLEAKNEDILKGAEAEEKMDDEPSDVAEEEGEESPQEVDTPQDAGSLGDNVSAELDGHHASSNGGRGLHDPRDNIEDFTDYGERLNDPRDNTVDYTDYGEYGVKRKIQVDEDSDYDSDGDMSDKLLIKLYKPGVEKEFHIPKPVRKILTRDNTLENPPERTMQKPLPDTEEWREYTPQSRPIQEIIIACVKYWMCTEYTNTSKFWMLHLRRPHGMSIRMISQFAEIAILTDENQKHVAYALNLDEAFIVHSATFTKVKPSAPLPDYDNTVGSRFAILLSPHTYDELELFRECSGYGAIAGMTIYNEDHQSHGRYPLDPSRPQQDLKCYHSVLMRLTQPYVLIEFKDHTGPENLVRAYQQRPREYGMPLELFRLSMFKTKGKVHLIDRISRIRLQDRTATERDLMEVHLVVARMLRMWNPPGPRGFQGISGGHGAPGGNWAYGRYGTFSRQDHFGGHRNFGAHWGFMGQGAQGAYGGYDTRDHDGFRPYRAGSMHSIGQTVHPSRYQTRRHSEDIQRRPRIGLSLFFDPRVPPPPLRHQFSANHISSSNTRVNFSGPPLDPSQTRYGRPPFRSFSVVRPSPHLRNNAATSLATRAASKRPDAVETRHPPLQQFETSAEEPFGGDDQIGSQTQPAPIEPQEASHQSLSDDNQMGSQISLHSPQPTEPSTPAAAAGTIPVGIPSETRARSDATKMDQIRPLVEYTPSSSSSSDSPRDSPEEFVSAQMSGAFIHQSAPSGGLIAGNHGTTQIQIPVTTGGQQFYPNEVEQQYYHTPSQVPIAIDQQFQMQGCHQLPQVFIPVAAPHAPAPTAYQMPDSMEQQSQLHGAYQLSQPIYPMPQSQGHFATEHPLEALALQQQMAHVAHQPAGVFVHPPPVIPNIPMQQQYVQAPPFIQQQHNTSPTYFMQGPIAQSPLQYTQPPFLGHPFDHQMYPEQFYEHVPQQATTYYQPAPPVTLSAPFVAQPPSFAGQAPQSSTPETVAAHFFPRAAGQVDPVAITSHEAQIPNITVATSATPGQSYAASEGAPGLQADPSTTVVKVAPATGAPVQVAQNVENSQSASVQIASATPTQATAVLQQVDGAQATPSKTDSQGATVPRKNSAQSGVFRTRADTDGARHNIDGNWREQSVSGVSNATRHRSNTDSRASRGNGRRTRPRRGGAGPPNRRQDRQH